MSFEFCILPWGFLLARSLVFLISTYASKVTKGGSPSPLEALMKLLDLMSLGREAQGDPELSNLGVPLYLKLEEDSCG